MTVATQFTNSVAHLPNAWSSAAAAEEAFISLAGTLARNTFASTMRPLSESNLGGELDFSHRLRRSGNLEFSNIERELLVRDEPLRRP